jgi:hypothetical protein
MIAAECERQMVGPVEVEAMHKAYEFARLIRPGNLNDVNVRWLGRLVEPVKAAHFRTLPVTFPNRTHAVHPDLIANAFKALLENQNRVSTDEFVKEFLDIHPFSDGNGRVAFLLYNILNNTLHYPNPLPDYFS